jgi:Mlc titration factor MtfA (ptsG expression regulator)
MFGRRKRAERAGLPDAWRSILDARSVQWRLLDPGERDRLGELADWLLRERRWEAARDFELTDEVRTLVSAHASLLVLELGESWYDEVGAVVVRAGAMDRAPTLSGGRGIVTRYPGVIDGEAHHDDGPLMVSWAAARREAAQPRWGRDVVLHEFAHKLDMLDGTLDGTPRLADEAVSRWVKVCTNHFEAVREGTGGRILRDYAGTNAAEFFAVATETFFTRPIELQAEKPDLYDVLAGFYRQDPAERWRRAAAATPVVSQPRIVVRYAVPRPVDSAGS